MRRVTFLSTLLFAVVTANCQVGNSIQEKKNLPGGAIWFTNDPAIIELPSFDKTKIKDSFSLLDDLYARVYLTEPLAKIYDKYHYTYDFKDEICKYNYALRIYADNSLKLQWLDLLDQNEFENSTSMAYAFASSNEALSQRFSILIDDWVELVKQLKPGHHTIRIDMVPLNRDNGDTGLPVIATGKFTLTVNDDDMTAFRMLKEPELPEATLKSTALENEILVASKAAFINAVPVKAIITDVKGDWTYSRDDMDNITGRQIIASVVYTVPPEGKCYIKTGQYYQSHQGNGIYDKALFVREVPGYFDYEVDCNSVK